MGQRGPQPKERTSRTIGAYCPNETADAVEALAGTRNRKTAFVAAECIRLGLAEFERLYPAVEVQTKEGAKTTVKKTTAKRARTAKKKGREMKLPKVPRRTI